MKKIVLILLTAVALTACKRSEGPEIPGDGPTVFELNPGSFDLTETRLSTAQENTLANVAVLQFDAAGAFVKYMYCSGAVANNKLTLDLTSGKKQTVVFVANVADAAPFKTFTGTLVQLRALTLTVANEAAVTTGNVMVMYGEYAGDIIGKRTMAAVVVKRIAAKIDFNYWVDIADAADKHESFTLKRIQLRSVPKVMSYSEPSGVYPATIASFGDYATIPVATQPTPSVKGVQAWYMPENKRGTGTAEIPSQKTAAALASGGDKATYVEMVGDYTKEGQTVELTYKLYLGADPVKDYNIVRNTNYKVEAIIKGANAVDLRISMTSGGGQLGLDDQPTDGTSGDAVFGGNPAANCYMLNPAASDVDLRIPVSRVNEIYRNRTCDRLGLLDASGYNQKDSLPSTVTAGKSWTVEVLWQDNAAQMIDITGGTVQTSKDYIRVKPRGVAGNCVLGLRRAGGNIVWSWHLWITDYEPTKSYIGDMEVGKMQQYRGWMVDNNKVIMDRNLGAMGSEMNTSSWGLLYQWGRKDPFVGASGSGNATQTWYVPNGSGGFKAATEADLAKIPAGTANNIYSAVMTPAAFFATSAAPNDWTTPQVADLWADGDKSLFDPCPVGWRVPRSAIWTGIVAADAVWQASGRALWNVVKAGPAWYPAQGYRSPTGAVTSVGTMTANWSSTVSGTSGSAWRIQSAFEAPSAQPRANAYPVRCMQE